MTYTTGSYPYHLKLSGLKPVPRPHGGNHNNSRFKYAPVITAFDIESSNIPDTDYSTMYVWQFAIEHDVIIGRTWDDYLYHLSRIDAELPEGQTMVIFDHNLSFEFQFLSGIYSFASNEVFAVQSRKVLTCRMFADRFEYRCSYLLTNMSLHELTYKYDVEHKKLDGDDFDYSEVRYPWTPLPAAKLQYAINDVLGLVEAIKKLMADEGDTLYTLPLTSTGFVRRDVKRAAKGLRVWVHNMAPDLQVFEMLYRAFRGGDTHANRYYAGQVIREVDSYDRSSSYPDVCVNCPFPGDKFLLHPGQVDEDRLQELVNVRHKAVLCDITLYNVRLRDPYWGAPYIPKAKCIELDRPVSDNGRVLRADKVKMSITDVDYRILTREYVWDRSEVGPLYYTRYKMMPQQIIDVINEYYRLKTELKGIAGAEAANTYMRSKAKLNSIYGMFATNPCKPDIIYQASDGDYHIDIDTPLEDRLAKANKKSFVPYCFGAWCTAWARYRLHEGMWLVGTDRFLYCDTDSIKYISEGGPVDWQSYNKARIKDSKAHGAYAVDAKGKTHYMGVFEQEDHMSHFKTLGAKKYCDIINGRLEATISGVTKDQWGKDGTLLKAGGAQELLDMAGGDPVRAITDYFTDDPLEPTVFTKSGGLQSKYYDGEPVLLHIDGHPLVVTRCIQLKSGDYTLGITGEYERLLCLSREELLKLDLLKCR